MGSEPPDPVLSPALLLGGSRLGAGVEGEDAAGGCGREFRLDRELLGDDADVFCSTSTGTYLGLLFDSCSKSEIGTVDVGGLLQSGARYAGPGPVLLEGCGSIDLNLVPQRGDGLMLNGVVDGNLESYPSGFHGMVNENLRLPDHVVNNQEHRIEKLLIDLNEHPASTFGGEVVDATATGSDVAVTDGVTQATVPVQWKKR
ncbi:unnamed protein product [Urochloa humidicola]